MMGKINKAFEPFMKDYKETLKSLKNKDKFECAACQNQTFILYECSDFPFFDCICSQCGCLYINR